MKRKFLYRQASLKIINLIDRDDGKKKQIMA